VWEVYFHIAALFEKIRHSLVLGVNTDPLIAWLTARCDIECIKCAKGVVVEGAVMVLKARCADY